ncbi:60S acidic ribosomal protein p3-2 [Phtheirospermum japonicum]|uniref:60S acidic ribosomal protein p3-2 n=1 Tax=Phtheirospermum japonicum TaxID=374723 RepID=A0A830C135_9LAMI|nr:60S acidic ribosomal protein p3-2 [Phtheirospermum japonicum]
MGVFTFVCRESGAGWSAKLLNGDLEASADGIYDLQRKLVQASVEADSSGAVQSSFSYVAPSSAVFQVVVGGGVFAGGVAASAPDASGGGAAADAPAAEEKKEEEKEESDDEAMFSLFD